VSYSALGIKFPLATYETIKDSLPPATCYRTLSSLNKGISIELYYILDAEIFSAKQKQWMGNIKTRIYNKLPFIEFVELDDISVRALSGETYNLKSLSSIWKRYKKIRNECVTNANEPKKSSLLDKLKDSKQWTDNELIDDDLIDDYIKIPQLVPFMQGAKPHENLYKTLCIYCKRLYYEKLFILEYLELAGNIYARDLDLLPKEVRKITLKAWTFISEQIELHPEDFKQRLEPEELKTVRINNAKRLQVSNQSKRASNIALVRDAIASGLHYKADGSTINKSSIAKATKLSRVTVSSVLDAGV